ncbi:MAG: hypothetical protein AB4352_29415 [Hormoscilla sp.]
MHEETEKVIEDYLKLICLEKSNEKWQKKWGKVIVKDEINNLDKIVIKYIEKFGVNQKKLEIEIRCQYDVDYESHESLSGESRWLIHTTSLMLRRCLQIWQKLNKAQIIRGLALQQRGINYMNGLIGALNSKKAIQKQGKGVDAAWVVMDINSLKPDRSKILPVSGVEAAKRRAREWKKQGLFSSDKS